MAGDGAGPPALQGDALAGELAAGKRHCPSGRGGCELLCRAREVGLQSTPGQLKARASAAHCCAGGHAVHDSQPGAMDDLEADDVNHNGGPNNRGSQKYYCGFLSSELIGIFFSVFLPLSDAWSDIAVIVGWYMADQMNWFVIGVIIHLIAGTLSGCLLAAWELSPRSNGIMATCWFPFGMVLGVLGLSPVVSALVALSDGGKDAGRERIERDFFFLKSIKAVELLFESLPQSAVQSYVGVSYGYLDPGADNFSPVLAVSVSIALVSAGTTLMGTEAMGRNLVLSGDYRRISLMTVYGVLTATWRFTQVGAFILWLSLFACYAKGWAAIPATVGVLTLGAMVWEAGFERSDPETQGVGKPKRLHVLHLFNVAGMCFFFFFSGTIPSTNFYWGPQANNYLNRMQFCLYHHKNAQRI